MPGKFGIVLGLSPSNFNVSVALSPITIVSRSNVAVNVAAESENAANRKAMTEKARVNPRKSAARQNNSNDAASFCIRASAIFACLQPTRQVSLGGHFMDNQFGN